MKKYLAVYSSTFNNPFITHIYGGIKRYFAFCSILQVRMERLPAALKRAKMERLEWAGAKVIFQDIRGTSLQQNVAIKQDISGKLISITIIFFIVKPAPNMKLVSLSTSYKWLYF